MSIGDEMSLIRDFIKSASLIPKKGRRCEGINMQAY